MVNKMIACKVQGRKNIMRITEGDRNMAMNIVTRLIARYKEQQNISLGICLINQPS